MTDVVSYDLGYYKYDTSVGSIMKLQKVAIYKLVSNFSSMIKS
jgi:hypothetical protein